MRGLDKENEKWKGPRRRTLGPGILASTLKLSPGFNLGTGVPQSGLAEAQPVMAADNYEALKAAMSQQARRTTAPVKKSKRGMLAVQEGGLPHKP
jgi:hypothetical protein